MKEIVIISGKGGTGKTSLTASFAALAKKVVIADCDVDAADLHLILQPEILKKEQFKGGYKAVIDKKKCIECGKCIELCRFDAISEDYVVDEISCEGCNVCAYFCPVKAIEMNQSLSGEFFISDTRFGPFVHAKLGIAEENSGKLVSLVRNNAKNIARKDGYDIMLVDGSPGVGCPVISSITGADYVIVVAEPTLSGIHDLKRILELTAHFRVKTAVCINKFDINLGISNEIENYCKNRNLKFLGKIPYDEIFIMAMIEKKCVVEYSNGKVANKIRDIWREILTEILN
ncbi:(4Fe-4S)-binding protein [candidate division KSB1 bacterium]|nr:MAG: (4Fe-4S)-binding protein [candidate division KSB1 bacterium]